MTLYQLIALGVVVLFFVLTFWGFARATEERVKILGLVASLAGVAAGYLLQEPRVQEKEEQAVEARAAAEEAYETVLTVERQFRDVQSILQNARTARGDLYVFPPDSIARVDSIMRLRPDFDPPTRFRR